VSRRFLALCLLVALLDICTVWLCVNPPGEASAKAFTSHLAKRWAVDRHEFHGIEVSKGDKVTGESWFYNQRGQRCKL